MKNRNIMVCRKLVLLLVVFAMVCSTGETAMASCTLCKQGKIRISCPQHVSCSDCICLNCGKKQSFYVATKCTECNGKGYERCFYCGGTGKAEVKYQGRVIARHDCSFCSGTGYDDCFWCEGGMIDTLRKECSSCGGRVVCPTCKGYAYESITCPICNDNDYSTQFSYRAIMRSPDSKIGNNYTLNGKISNISNIGDQVYELTLFVEDEGISYNYPVTWFAAKGSDKLLKGDSVTVYGVFSSYDKQNTPSFVSAYIKLSDG